MGLEVMEREVETEVVGADKSEEQFPSAYRVIISPGSIPEILITGVVDVPAPGTGVIVKLVVTKE
jgi:hypothetical protein